jgi:ribosomal protein S18 acetylase RimI-like enzyme
MFVRTASKRDLPAVRDLLVETWHATNDEIYGAERVAEIMGEWHSNAALEARLDVPMSEFLVADDGKTIGAMAFADAVDDKSTVMLRQLYVLPECQGRGIGGMLLDEVEGCFPEAARIRLEVEEANAKAVAFYIAQGFAKVGAGKSAGGASTAIYERPIVWA